MMFILYIYIYIYLFITVYVEVSIDRVILNKLFAKHTAECSVLHKNLNI
jgi:hypothetical protein